MSNHMSSNSKSISRSKFEQLLRDNKNAPNRTGFVRCPRPEHEDNHPSAKFYEQNGRWRVHCFVCATGFDYYDVRGFYGAETEEGETNMDENIVKMSPHVAANIFGIPRPPPAANGNTAPGNTAAVNCAVTSAALNKATAGWSSVKARVSDMRSRNRLITDLTVYGYKNAEGEVDFAVIRYYVHGEPKKSFIQMRRTSRGTWVDGAPEKTPLYNLPEVLKAPKVLVVEGEKDANTFNSFGIADIVATTVAGGANGVVKSDLTPLIGKRVITWRDNDEVGYLYEKNIIDTIRAMDPGYNLGYIDIGGLGLLEKEDLTDYFAHYPSQNRDDQATHAELLVMDAVDINPERDHDEWIEDRISGKSAALTIPSMPTVAEMTRAIKPGTVCFMPGNPSSGKTWVLLEMMTHYLDNGITTKALFLEEPENFYRDRLYAQLSQNSGFLDDKFSNENPELVREIKRVHAERASRVARHALIVEALPHDHKTRELDKSDHQNILMTYDKIADWAAFQLHLGAKVLIIDPITAAAPNERPWEADQKFLLKIKRLAVFHSAVVVISTHPKGGIAGNPETGGMAGCTAFERFAQTVLWLEIRNVQERKIVQSPTKGEVETSVDLYCHIRKARNGFGRGKRIALHFNPLAMRVEEYGMVLRDAPQADEANGKKISLPKHAYGAAPPPLDPDDERNLSPFG